MAVIDVQIVLALAWVETLLQLEQLPVFSKEYFLDLVQVDFLPQEWWLATHWTANKWEQTPQQGPGLMMVVTAHLSFAGEHSCDKPHDETSQPHMISHPVDFAKFLSAILAFPAETVLALLHLLFSRDLVDRQHPDFNT